MEGWRNYRRRAGILPDLHRFRAIREGDNFAVPHEMLHYPDMILESPILGLGLGILGSAVFGLPMALLMKRRNLQMAVGLHWFIDFVRFAAGV